MCLIKIIVFYACHDRKRWGSPAVEDSEDRQLQTRGGPWWKCRPSSTTTTKDSVQTLMALHTVEKNMVKV